METDPVTGGSFFGRREVIEKISKRFYAFEHGYRQNIGLIGRPFTGKSSVIAQFLRSQSFSQTVPIFIRVEEADSFPVFCQKWLAAILYGYQRFLGMQPSVDFQKIVRHMRRYLPRVVKEMRRIRRLAEKKQWDVAYREMLCLTTLFSEETKKKALLIIEDFDRISRFGISDPFSALGKEIMVQKETMFFVTSSNPQTARHIFREKLSLLFSNFEVIEIEPFSFKEAETWIDQRFESGFQNGFIRRALLRLTNGHPFYLDLILRRIAVVLVLRGQQEVTQTVLIEALDAELFDHRGVLYHHFLMNVLSVSRQRSSLSSGDVLLAIAIGMKKLSAMTRYLQKSSDEVKNILQRLVQEQLVLKSGSFYDIPDTLFRFWLKEVYYRKRLFLDADTHFARDEFRVMLQRHFSQMEKEDRKEVPARIEELLRLFGNDVIEFGQKKMKFPRFTEVAVRVESGKTSPIVAKNLNTRWLCKVVEEQAKEEDVRSFLDDSRKMRSRVHKKLMISLKGIDLNAKLLAHEAKVHLWDLKDLNYVLDLYGQAKVVQ